MPHDLQYSLPEARFIENLEIAESKLAYDAALSNKPEPKSFLKAALAWQGSVTPQVLTRVGVATGYATFVLTISSYLAEIHLPITPFEYSGSILALILVLRVNAGQDRWWEARKIWGAIVNQSRNLAVVIHGSQKHYNPLAENTLKWIAAWPHVMRESLRQEKCLKEVKALLGWEETDKIRCASHMPTYVALRIKRLLVELRGENFDAFVYHRAETERSQLMDAIGACERIRNTRMPLVLAIKTRRFILLFLLLLPFALIDRAGLLTPLVVALTAYPLFSLDEIGAELQNPFSPRNLSHLPLNDICDTIERNIKEILQS